MKPWSVIILAALALGGAAAAAPSAAEFAEHQGWDKLLIQGPPVAGAARHWQRPVWPWQGMIGGSDLGTSLLATLAAGAPEAPAAIDPAIAKKTAWRAARPDGVLVRPDLALTPTQQSSLPQAVAAKEPMVAWACTDHAGQRTGYVFCYDRMDHPVEASFTPAESGFSGTVMVLNRGSGEAWREPAEEAYQASLNPTGYAYFELAPVRPNGLVFFGDQGKFVSAGRQRIARIANIQGGVAVTVVFAPGEHDVSLFGFAPSAPKARAQSGGVGAVAYSNGNGRYTVPVSAPDAGGGLRQAEIEIVLEPPAAGQSPMRFPVAAIVGLAFCASELAIVVFKRSKPGVVSKDRNSLRILIRIIFLAILLGVWAGRSVRWGWWPHPREIAALGIALFAAGTALRWWAIVQLGRFFTVDVAIAPDHRLVEAGPYRWLRHPSYAGALVAFLGMALTMGNLVSLLVMLVPVAGAFLWRMAIEEAALVEAFGDGYRDYRGRTKRLIPFIY